MRASRKSFKNKLRWCQKNEENIKLNILAESRKDKNFVKFWKDTKKFNYKQSLPLTVDGLQEPELIANMFARKFQIKPQPVSNNNDNLQTCHKSLDNIFFEVRDIECAITNMKRGKSPGHDNLSVEHVLYAGKSVAEKLTVLFNMCIKFSYLPPNLMKTLVVPIIKNKTGDTSSGSNYRPISLGTVVGKVFERLLQPKLLKNIKIEDAQFGFRPGLSTDTAILSLKQTVDYYLSRQTTVYACFLDLSRAFDLVNYKILWSKLRDSGVDPMLVSLLECWYGGQKNVVKWGDATSNSYRLECGVRQGGLTSPDLFNIYINNLIERLRSTRVGCHIGGVCVNNLSYADDMVLLSPSIKGLRALLRVCEHYANEHGLKYNALKTEMMVFRSCKGPENVPVLKWEDGTVVKVVKQFKYLGHILCENLKDDQDIERERRALSIRCNMLARRFGRCSDDVKLTLFRAYCQSFYTCQLWSKFNRSANSTMRIQYNDAFRILMKRPRFCSASGMFAEAGVPDFFAIIRTRIASFWERIKNSRNEILRTIGSMPDCYIYKYWLTVHQSGNKK